MKRDAFTDGMSKKVVRIWNSLPLLITSALSLPVFCSRLKTYFFELCYP